MGFGKVAILAIPVSFIAYAVISNIKTTIETAKALKISITGVKWLGIQGDILHPLQATFSVLVNFKIQNPTGSPITMDYMKLQLSILGKVFGNINDTTPIVIGAKQTISRSITVKSDPIAQMGSDLESLINGGKIPTGVHIKGVVSANTWSAGIDDDFTIMDALSSYRLNHLLYPQG